MKNPIRLVFGSLVFLLPGLTLMSYVRQAGFSSFSGGGCTVEVQQQSIRDVEEKNTSNHTAYETNQTSYSTYPPTIRKPPRQKRFFELHEEVYNMTKLPDEITGKKKQANIHTAYQRAKVVSKATPWFPKRHMCRDDCCVETVAISLDQDDRQIIHNRLTMDFADLMILKWHSDKEFFGTVLSQKMLPCLVPATIITVENLYGLVKDFWEITRPNITVPFVLNTAFTDMNSPIHPQYIADPLLMSWYGSNPLYPKRKVFQDYSHKYRHVNLGLSNVHQQEINIRPYLQLTNYSNPFLDKERWDFSKHRFDFDRDVFIHFGQNRDHRKILWQALCPDSINNTSPSATVSCHNETKKLPPYKIYADMSNYRFGVSPPGYGFDCYRTYEMLLLGVIPIIEERPQAGHDLFDGLPVIHMTNLKQASRDNITDAIHRFIEDGVFQEESFQEGWKHLFLRHKRRQILQDSGRDKDIIQDESGKEYYQGFKYTVVNKKKIEECKRNKGCQYHKRKNDANDFADALEWKLKWER